MSNHLPDNPNEESVNNEGSFSIDELQGPSPRLQNVSFSSAGSSCPLDYSDDVSLTIPVSPVSQDDDDDNEKEVYPINASDDTAKADSAEDIQALQIESDVQVESPTTTSPSNCFLEGMKMLLDGGAECNIQDIYKRTPLHLACENTQSDIHHDCVKLLLKRGTNCNIQDVLGR